MIAKITRCSLVLACCAAAGCSLFQGVSGNEDDPRSKTRPGQWTFDDVPPGLMPPGWSFRETAPKNTPGKWMVAVDADPQHPQHVLALTETANKGQTYNVALALGTKFKDLQLDVQVKAVSGIEDQGGGPVWRCTDENNYYLCRLNPLEGNFRLYKVTDGVRKQLASAELPLDVGRWYAVSVAMEENQITCGIDGKDLLHVEDEETFTGPGMVGLWTKADAVTSFDNLSVAELVTR